MKIFKKWWWYSTGFHLHKIIWTGIKNIIKWMPIVWKDRDWDHAYIMYALRFKIKNTADYIEKNKRYEGWERDVQKMRLCVRLFDALEQDIYELEYQDYYNSGMFKEESFDKLDEYLAKYPNYVRRLNIVPESGNNISAALLIGHYRHQRATKLLFELINRNIYFWWD